MDDENLVNELLGKGEGATLDFKSKQYRLDNDHFKACFVKDILSMANTPRSGSAYILVGVSVHQDGTKALVGLESHHDDADLQSIVANWTSPSPEFHYRAVEHGGVRLGLIEIAAVRRGPFTAVRDYKGTLRRNAVYRRRGSQNDEARADELKEIVAWMPEAGEVEASGVPPREVLVPCWSDFYDACHKFEPGRAYVLIVPPPPPVPQEYLEALGRIDWSVVLDFDPSTDESGTLVAARKELHFQRRIHLVTLDDIPDMVPSRATYWVAARGLADRPSTTTDGTWRGWNRKYGIGLRSVFQHLAESADGRPASLVILWSDAEYVRAICAAADSAFGDSVDFVFAVHEPAQLEPVARAFASGVIDISLPQVCRGLAHSVASRVGDTELAALPTLGGEPAVLSVDELRWLEEDLEVVHLGAGQREMDGRSPGLDFYRGMVVTWFDLAMHKDIDREVTAALMKQVEADLDSRGAIRLNIYHWPGAGGTTVARRLAWELHGRYPAVVLRKLRGENTLARLRFLFDRTRLPPLVIAEAGAVAVKHLEQLYGDLRSRQIPVVFVTVLRRFERGQSEERKTSERSVYIGSTLTRDEAYRFAQAYSEQAPSRRDALFAVVGGKEPRHKTPFYFGLVTYEEDFVSLEDYVARRLVTATDVQREITLFTAMVYHYAQTPVSAQLFAGLLRIPQNRVVRLEQLLSEPLRDLLLLQEPNSWRPVHELVAEEIVEQVLAGSSDRRAWSQNLSGWAIRLAELCAEGAVCGRNLMDMLARMFVLRDSEELLGTEASYRHTYSRLLDDIPTKEGKIAVLQRLVELFPSEPHFWGHLGRLLSIEFRDDERALKAIDRAIELDPSDSVLHHMKGMTLRRQAYELMEGAAREGSSGEVMWEHILRLVGEAGEEFREARRLAPQDEHGYVSHMQMIIRTVDFAFRASRAESKDVFLGGAGSRPYQEMLDDCENLLEDLQRLRAGQAPGFYLTQCQADLSGLYGDYSRVLERWTNLLGRRDIYQPPVRRQLVRAYLVRRGRSWDDLEEREVSRILELMEENMLQEPANDRNVRLWFHAARRSARYGLETAIEKLSYWRANSDSVDARFYLYILHVLQALDGSELACEAARDLMRECSRKAEGLRNRHYSLEWLGHGLGLARIVNHQRLGDDWEKEFEGGGVLGLAQGRIASIRRLEAGEIELTCGLKAFFVPGRGHAGETFAAGADENLPVQFYLAFTYDGLRAWAVRQGSA